MKSQFLEKLMSIDRQGMNDLILYIEQSTDFFSAPASTRHHDAHEGGLLKHSLAVYENLVKIMDTFFDEYDQESVIIVSLLHDLCKANFYTVSYRNAKDPIINGQQLYGWHQVPYYTIEDQLPMGHGEKSLYLIMKFIAVTDEEAAAIRWHMGGFDDAARGYSGQHSLSNAMKKYPLVAALHMADLSANYL